ncbi:MAG: Uma2 family endonuclease [Planctomycetales bacterium]|nr:Uma2 family endonuclease [Planctomycetales bacterium]
MSNRSRVVCPVPIYFVQAILLIINLSVESYPSTATHYSIASNTWEEIREKTREYFRAGVERVWVVSAKQREVHIYDSPTDVRILSDDGELTDALLPGFSLPISELFAMVEITTDEAVEQ